MSRLFDDASTEYLQRSQAVLSGVPMAMVCWFNSNAGIHQTLMGITDISENDHFLCLHLTDANKLWAYVYGGVGNEGLAVASSDWSVDTWHHACALFVASNDHRVLLDGGSKGTSSGGATPSNLDTTFIGRRSKASPQYYVSGMIAEPAFYDLSELPGATASDKADYFEANVLPGLAAERPPSAFPVALDAYWPLEGASLEDEVNGFDLTAFGSSVSTDHPQIDLCANDPIAAQSSLVGDTKTTELLQGSLGGEAGISGDIISIEILAGLVPGQSAAAGTLNLIKALAGSLGAQSTASANINKVLVYSLAGLIEGQSGLSGNINITEQLSGLIEAQATLTAKLRDLSSLSGTCDAHTSVAGVLQSIESLAGLIAGQSNVSGILQTGYAVMPPAMHAALIDPYSGGAWLWLVEIHIPGYPIIYLARNPVDVVYSGVTYNANNLEIGLAALIGDSSVPRTLVKVVQDGYYTLEDKINATKGAGGGTIKIIRTHEDFLDKFVAELEQTVKILTADSNTNDIVFRLGIPDPLTKKIPLRRYSSKICPHHVPGLFKGIECQYAGEDATCTGKYTDCLTKENEIHWGGDLGLDPNVAKI